MKKFSTKATQRVVPDPPDPPNPPDPPPPPKVKTFINF